MLELRLNSLGNDDMEGIMLYCYSKLVGDISLSPDFLDGLLPGDYLPDGLKTLPNKLRYLEWYICPLKTWPLNFCAEQLVALNMRHSNLEKLWDGVQNLMNLKSIDLSYSCALVEIPDLSKAEKLEKISLCGCHSLRELHSSILSLPNLTHLDLSGCLKIEILESTVEAKSLIELNLERCLSLKKFSMTSDKMKLLDISYTAMCSLPQSVCHFLSLERLKLSGIDIVSLPADIKILSKLTFLHLDLCKKLVTLPSLPPSLEELRLKCCHKLMSLSELPSSLVRLYLMECNELDFLPKLSNSLVILDLDGCMGLMSLPELPSSLMKLNLNHCQELVSLPDLPSSLMKLFLNDCRKLVFLPEHLPLLKYLRLNNFLKLKSLPKLPSSVQTMSGCHCISLNADITQKLVLEHICKSCIPYLHEQYLKNQEFHHLGYFVFPGDHVTNECAFRTAKNSMIISYLPKVDFVGFICCVIISKEHELDVSDDAVSHNVLGYTCVKLVNSEELLEWESIQRDRPIIVECLDDENENDVEWSYLISQISDYDAKAKAIGVECSNIENEDDRDQFLERWDSVSQISYDGNGDDERQLVSAFKRLKVETS
ncbi:hypothetical protein VNO78_12328 [Psophocarpus tetragonolobus]|uniref:Uncharacterized protein n=1 Tax=Psophocarpus tetragonolobus TaxID=3891 RepID=A0AAN9XPR6_PSOTE